MDAGLTPEEHMAVRLALVERLIVVRRLRDAAVEDLRAIHDQEAERLAGAMAKMGLLGTQQPYV
jgi:hypothetical protein